MLRWATFFRAILRLLVSGAWVYAELFVMAGLLLGTTPVQNAFRPWLVNEASAALGVAVQVSYINVGLPDHLVLHDVVLCDRADLEMLRVKRLGVSVLNTALWDFVTGATTRHLRARSVQLDGVLLSLYHRTKDGRLNWDVVFEGEEAPPPDTSAPSGKLTLVTVPSISIRNMRFRFVDSVATAAELRPTPGHVNYTNLNLQDIAIDASFFWLGAGHYKFDVSRFGFSEVHSGVRVKKLATTFEADQHWPLHDTLPDEGRPEVSFIRFDNTRIELEQTRIEFDVLFWNEEYRSLFRDDAPKRYVFDVKPSRVDFRSVNWFTPEDLPLVGLAQLQGRISGDPNRLRCKDLRVDYGRYTHIEADVRLQDYLRSDSIFIQARLSGACTEGNELHALLPTSELPNELRRVGKVCVTGNYVGFIRDFVADARFETDLGVIETDLNFKRLVGAPVFYEGRLLTESFDLDALLGTDVSHRLNLDAKLYGQGLTLADADTKLDFTSRGSLYKSYTLDSINGSIRVANRDISGGVNIRDAEGSFEGKIDVNLSKGTPSYFFLGDIQAVDLHHYGLTADTLRLSTIFNVNLSGDSLDNLSGTVRCFELGLSNVPRAEQFLLKDIVVSSRLNSATSKSLLLNSRLGTATVQGNFSYAEAAELLKRLAYESELFFRNQTDSIATYYASKTEASHANSLKAQVLVRELNPLLQFLRSPLRVAAGSELQSRFAFGQVDQASVKLSADSLAWGSQRWRALKADLTLEKPSTQNLLVGNGQVHAERWVVAEGVAFDRLSLTPYIRNRRVDLKLGLSQDTLKKRLDILGSVGLLDSGFVASINADSSRMVLYDAVWRFDADNRIEYGPQRLLIDDLRLSTGQQSISIEADAGAGRQDVLFATARNVELSRLAEIFLPEAPVSGVVNGTLQLRHPLSKPRLQVEGSVRRFQYDNLTYGDVFVRSRLSEMSERMFLTSNLVYRGDTLLGLRGYYDADQEQSPLNFVLATQNLPAKLIEPFVKGILYDVEGKVQIEALQVRGRLAAPTITGEGRLEGVKFGADYFKTRYELDGKLRFSQRLITLDEMRVRDVRGNTARIEGNIRHYGFTRLDLDLRVRDMRNFLFMDTKVEDNELFYGRVIVRRGSADVRGRFGDLVINADLSTGVGTAVAIPVSYYRKQTRLPFVRFKKSGEDADAGPAPTHLDLLGMALNLEIEATPDAEGKIVFDERTNDVITMNGSGGITMLISRTGDFNMYGTYEVERGLYPFNFRKLFSRTFSVERGGTISWNGDPYEAQLNVSAINRVNASLSSLDTTIRSTQLVPVEVYLKLRGSMFRPEVTFDVQFPNVGQESSLALGALQRSITNDPQALNNQVISLLAFQRFAPQGNFFAGGGAAGGVASSATELISNQLNNLIGQALDNRVQVGLSSNQFNDFNLAVRATLFNNRLTIERNGILVSQTNRNVTIGNISARYRLLPSERRLQLNPNPLTLSVEIFNRENFGFGNQLVSTSRGGGVFLRKEFDTFGELLPVTQAKRDTSTVVAVDSTLLRSARQAAEDSTQRKMAIPDSSKRDTTRRDTTRRDTSGRTPANAPKPPRLNGAVRFKE